jgi:sarcosine oxidase, subunit delta
MKIMPCPLNGPRNISEFACLGEVSVMPDPNAADDRTWSEHVWFSNNTAGVVREWWCHVPTSYWFIAERDTVTDEILRTYPSGEVFKDRVDFKARVGEPDS